MVHAHGLPPRAAHHMLARGRSGSRQRCPFAVEQLESRRVLAALVEGAFGTLIGDDLNDEIREAAALGASWAGTIDQTTDVDMLKITVAAGERVQFDLDRTGGTLDSYLRLFNAAGTQLAFSDDDPAPGESRSNDSYIVYTFGSAGTFYLGVSAYNNKLYNPVTGGGDANGSSTGSYLITVTRGGTPPPPPAGGFRIDVSFGGGLTAAQQAVFSRAANRWAEVITGDLPNVTYNGRVIDDLLIAASGIFIDGPGNILGQAGPRQLRSGSNLPYYGIMQFDTADLAAMERDGTLYEVILHEMGHVIGIGTIWARKGLLVGAGTANPRFLGANATREYRALFGVLDTSVPVEGNNSGVGSRDSHWRESIFRNELMTPRIGSVGNPLSRVTVASLADLGYTVNMNAANPFARPSVAAGASIESGGSATSLGRFVALAPDRIQLAFASLAESRPALESVTARKTPKAVLHGLTGR